MGQLGIGTRPQTRWGTPRHLSYFPDHAGRSREVLFLEPAHDENILEGLRKAGLTLEGRKH